VPQLIVNAVKEGGITLDNYDYLVPYYSKFGFVPVAKVRWDDAQAPPDWDKKAFKKFNNGEPDVVAMAYHGGDPNTLSERVGQFGDAKTMLDNAPYVENWDEAKKLQKEYVDRVNAPKGAKEAISAPIVEKGTDVPPIVEEPPKVDTKPSQEGGAERTLGVRALNSQKLDQDIKDGIAKEGINYEPRGRKVRAEEAEEIISLFSKEEGGLDKVEAMVYNTKNDIPNDTRTYLNVYLAKEYTNQKNSTTDPAERDRLRQKAIDLYMFGMEQGTNGGQFVEAQ
jgi:hypothetical protein